MKKAAVVLCGSGYKDGSEIREAVGILWALSAEKISAQIFAPDEKQAEVVNCLTGEPAPENRNQLVEAARIARGEVAPLAKLRAGDFDLLLIPGGFGAAKNLCSFAFEGSKGKVNAEMKKVLQEFRRAAKPIGAVCVAPAILALTFAGEGLELTVGARSEASAEIEKLGHTHVEKAAHEWHIDRAKKIGTSPAYMYDAAPLDQIFLGIRGLVRELSQLA